MYIDRIDLSLPEALVSSVLAAFATAESQLTALPSLSPSDRKHLAKLGLKNEGLARQIIEVGRSNPELIPRGIHFEQIDRDLVAREQLLALKLVLERLLGRVNDAMQLTGIDIYAAALSIYHCLKRNADKASVKGVVDELKKGFARPSRKKKSQEQAEAAAEERVSTPSAGPATHVLRAKPSLPEATPAERATPAPTQRPEQPKHPAPLRPSSPSSPQLQTTPLLFFFPYELPSSFCGSFTPPSNVLPLKHHGASSPA